jgi:hypothetical protein
VSLLVSAAIRCSANISIQRHASLPWFITGTKFQRIPVEVIPMAYKSVSLKVVEEETGDVGDRSPSSH